MKTKLRPYQQTSITETREALKKHRAVCIQLATGAGKTPIMADICKKIVQNKKTAWIIVPRIELLHQSGQHLSKWDVPHGIIAPGYAESKAYKVHVVSKDTLIRRYDKIKTHPALMFIDECHIALDRQLEIASKFPDTRIVGMTGTPERLDGRGLSELYGTLIEGPSIPDLMEQDFLTKLRYFSPPIVGLEDLHRRGTEYASEELDELLKRKKIYGKCINHYREYADGKSALVFCRDVKSAYETADRFCDAGYKFFCIEGKMSHKKRRQLIDALKTGEIHGLTNCEIATYGLDIPRVEVGIGLRPTLSKALYFQMIGRCLRPYPGKEHALFFDHVNNLFEHEDENYPGIPLHYVPHLQWDFYGREKRKRKEKPKDELFLKLCPNCFLYFEGQTCPNCGAAARTRQTQPIETIEGELEELKPVKLRDLPIDKKREMIDRMNSIPDFMVDGIINAGAVGEWLRIARELGNSLLWVYFELTKKDRSSINVPLLHEIARQKNYKPGWAWYAKKEIQKRMSI